MNADNAAFRDFRASLERPGEPVGRRDMSDDERVRRAEATFMRRLDGRMAVDLETCIHCGMCAEACHFYMATEDEKYTPVYKLDPLRRFYRRELSPMRWLYRPFTRRMNIDDLGASQELVYESCTGCGRCDMMCPMGISLSKMIMVMREALAEAGMVPEELQALTAEQKEHRTVFGVGTQALRDLAERLAAQGIEIPIDRSDADVMLLTTAAEVLLFADTLAATARILGRLGVSWTIRSDAFEAANLGLVSGDAETRRQVAETVGAQARVCGASTVIVPESGHAYQALRWESANWLGEAPGFEVLAVSEFIAREVDAGRLELKSSGNGGSVTYHDPCRLGRHGGVYEQPRQLLAKMGIEVRDTPANRRENLCCGGGCGEYVIRQSAPLRQKAFELKKKEIDETQADAVVTGCANCRINLMLGADNAGWQKPIGSLVEMVAANLAD